MAELIDKGAFIEDIKTEIVNLSMDGLKGTQRDRSDLYGMIDRINEQPTTTEAEIRAKAEHTYENCHNITCRRKCQKDGYNMAIEEFAEKLKTELTDALSIFSERREMYERESDIGIMYSHGIGTLKGVRYMVDEIAEQLKGE
jgi:hypothetical protein